MGFLQFIYDIVALAAVNLFSPRDFRDPHTF